MDTRVLDFLATQRVGVLAVTMPDGTVHAATLHFAYEGGVLLFSTSPTSRKVQGLQGDAAAASVVIGVNEAEMCTLQMDGTAMIVDDPAQEAAYFRKFPEKVGKYPENILVRFTSTWWRFTNFRAPQGRLIVTSE